MVRNKTGVNMSTIIKRKKEVKALKADCNNCFYFYNRCKWNWKPINGYCKRFEFHKGASEENKQSKPSKFQNKLHGKLLREEIRGLPR